jgi:hypothetical protein
MLNYLYTGTVELQLVLNRYRGSQAQYTGYSIRSGNRQNTVKSRIWILAVA